MPSVGQRARSLEQYLLGLGRIGFVPPALLACGMFFFALHQVHEAGVAEVNILAEAVAADVDADLRRRLQGVRALVVTVAFRTQEDSSWQWNTEAGLYDKAFDTPLALLDGELRMLLHTRLPSQLVPSIAFEEFRRAVASMRSKDAAEVSDATLGPVLREPVVLLLVPVPDQPQMLLVGVVVTRKFQELLTIRSLRPGLHVAILDGVGQVIASTERGLWKVGRDADPPRRASVKLTTAGWTVVAQADAWPFYKRHLQLSAAMTLLVLITMMAALLTARRASRDLVVAMRSLADDRPDGRGAGSDAQPAQLIAIVEVEAARAALQHARQVAQDAEQAERDRIARELHDGLQQLVAVVRLHLDTALATAGKVPVLQQSLQRAQEFIDQVSKEIQQILHALRPHALARMGLERAMAELVRLAQQAGPLQVELEFVGRREAVDALPRPVADALYRIAQESLNNVRKHAQASFVHVVLDTSQPTQVLLSISDDGVGVSTGVVNESSGRGLLGMLQRAQMLGGELRVERGHHGDRSSGTTVAVKLPIRPA